MSGFDLKENPITLEWILVGPDWEGRSLSYHGIICRQAAEKEKTEARNSEEEPVLAQAGSGSRKEQAPDGIKDPSFLAARARLERFVGVEAIDQFNHEDILQYLRTPEGEKGIRVRIKRRNDEHNARSMVNMDAEGSGYSVCALREYVRSRRVQ